MAGDNSFDIVSEVDMAEVTNAVNQATKEIDQRYDFKGTGTKIELDTKARKIVLHTASEFTLQNLVAVLEQKLIRRKVPVRSMAYGNVEPATKDTVRQTVDIQVGVPIEKAREIVKFVKELKLKKVQVAIQGEQLRVSGKDRDDLQQAIAHLRDHDFGIALQFTNYRSS